jgi:hypothetical protein
MSAVMPVQAGTLRATDLEVVRWMPAGAELPDAETMVILWLVSDEAGEWFEAGFWDGECWRLAESGGLPTQRVTHWTQLNGPTT